MKKMLALLLAGAMLVLLPACKAEEPAKNEFFTDTFFSDVTKVTTIGRAIPPAFYGKLFAVLKSLEFAGPYTENEEIVGFSSFEFYKENGDLCSFILVGDHAACRIEAADPAESRALFGPLYVAEESLAKLRAVFSEYTVLSWIEEYEAYVPLKTKRENDVFTKASCQSAEKIVLRFGSDEQRVGDGIIMREHYEDCDVDRAALSALLRTLGIGGAFDKEGRDVSRKIAVTLEEKDGSAATYKFYLCEVSGNQFEKTPSYVRVPVPVLEMPDGSRRTVPYEDYGALLYTCEYAYAMTNASHLSK